MKLEFAVTCADVFTMALFNVSVPVFVNEEPLLKVTVPPAGANVPETTFKELLTEKLAED